MHHWIRVINRDAFMETLINATMRSGRARDNRERSFETRRRREEEKNVGLDTRVEEWRGTGIYIHNVQCADSSPALSLSPSPAPLTLSLSLSLEPFESIRTSRLDDTEEIEICDDYADEIFVSFNGGLGASRASLRSRSVGGPETASLSSGRGNSTRTRGNGRTNHGARIRSGNRRNHRDHDASTRQIPPFCQRSSSYSEGVRGRERGPASAKRRRRREGRDARTGGNGGRIPQESRGVERRAYGGVPRARLEALSV